MSVQLACLHTQSQSQQQPNRTKYRADKHEPACLPAINSLRAPVVHVSCQLCERRRSQFICSLTAWAEMTRTNTPSDTLATQNRFRSHYPSIHVSRHPGKTRFPSSSSPSWRELRRQPAAFFPLHRLVFIVTFALLGIGLQHPSTASRVCTPVTQRIWTTESCSITVLSPSSC